MVRVHPTVPSQLNFPPLQRLFDTPDVFAPQKIQKALQMALRMVRQGDFKNRGLKVAAATALRDVRTI